MRVIVDKSRHDHPHSGIHHPRFLGDRMTRHNLLEIGGDICSPLNTDGSVFDGTHLSHVCTGPGLGRPGQHEEGPGVVYQKVHHNSAKNGRGKDLKQFSRIPPMRSPPGAGYDPNKDGLEKIMKSQILIIDDDSAISKLVTTCLREQGYCVRHAATADAGIAILKQEPVSLILLDISLPGISGLQALEIIKQTPDLKQIPVIMLTSHSEESMKVSGLEKGADDYIVKPFSLRELIARIEALNRRIERQGAIQNVLASGEIFVDLDNHMVRARNERVDVTRSEFEFLRCLISSKGRTLPYRVLVDELSMGQREITSESLYQFAKNLRRKLGQPGNAIETVYGVGYRLAQ